MKQIAGLMNKVRREDERGFTIVELMMVVLISLIMMAGMVVLIAATFQIFNSSKDLESITDSQRRTLLAMSRILRSAVHFINSDCTETKVTFYSDIDDGVNEKLASPPINPTAIDADNYVDTSGRPLTELVQLSELNGAQPTNSVMISVTKPRGTTSSTAKLGSFVADSGLKFFYFQKGTSPSGSDPFNPTNSYIGDINGDVGMIRIVLIMKKGNTTRKFFQDVFLRILQRTG